MTMTELSRCNVPRVHLTDPIRSKMLELKTHALCGSNPPSDTIQALTTLCRELGLQFKIQCEDNLHDEKSPHDNKQEKEDVDDFPDEWFVARVVFTEVQDPVPLSYIFHTESSQTRKSAERKAAAAVLRKMAMVEDDSTEQIFARAALRSLQVVR
eukprot:TRINITY_DN3783_c0_g1_i6.p1 TRINITY_DN3783_c0_g1~~TRINITY_DN3783_c0_g1_i6.p1  ORF type:complete len:155 (+),score=32.37 TRINITY_DN3783_c0_g1_i6:191-655(+)